jgi:ubiquitin-protein ligase
MPPPPHATAAHATAGTGFAGDESDGNSLAAVMKKAQKRQGKHDNKSEKYLRKMNDTLLKERKNFSFLESFLLDNDDSPTSSGCSRKKLLETLLDAFRNHGASDWNENHGLATAALGVCDILGSDLQLATLFGDANEESSLMTALSKLSQQAHLLAKKSNADVVSQDSSAVPYAEDASETDADISIATYFLQVKDKAERAVYQIAQMKASAAVASAITSSPPSTSRARKRTRSQMSKSSPSQGSATATKKAPSVETRYKEEMERYPRIDFVDDIENHAFADLPQTGAKTRQLYKELIGFGSSLPLEYGSSIFVRGLSSHLSLLRVLIFGPEDTPYANGCLFFDVYLPPSYPADPPKVKFLTTGGGAVRFNPNLYKDGKVCLSLIGTWPGPGWIPNQSTLLQVLLSIQSLILVPDPYWNEPAWDLTRGTKEGEEQCALYNLQIAKMTAQHVLLDPLRECCDKKKKDANSLSSMFRDVVAHHFTLKESAIEKELCKKGIKSSAWSHVKPRISKISEELQLKEKARKLQSDVEEPHTESNEGQTKRNALENNDHGNRDEVVVIDLDEPVYTASAPPKKRRQTRNLPRRTQRPTTVAPNDVIDLTL